MVSIAAGEHFLMVPVPVAASGQAGAEARRGWDATDSPQIHERAGEARARSDSGIAMCNPAAKDPDLTSALRGFNPGRACFQGNCGCLCFACLLLACCLLVACFCLLLLSFACLLCLLFPARAGGQS